MWKSEDARNWRDLQPILEHLLTLSPERVREELERRCDENPELWAKVARLLREEAENPNFLAPPTEAPPEE